jgi:hypothetical protein
MKDQTQGLSNGDHCPSCKKGVIQIRETVDSDKYKNVEKIKYAQCSSCSWNSMR